jgi:hypothetical protein
MGWGVRGVGGLAWVVQVALVASIFISIPSSSRFHLHQHSSITNHHHSSIINCNQQ